MAAPAVVVMRMVLILITPRILGSDAGWCQPMGGVRLPVGSPDRRSGGPRYAASRHDRSDRDRAVHRTGSPRLGALLDPGVSRDDRAGAAGGGTGVRLGLGERASRRLRRLRSVTARDARRVRRGN